MLYFRQAAIAITLGMVGFCGCGRERESTPPRVGHFAPPTATAFLSSHEGSLRAPSSEKFQRLEILLENTFPAKRREAELILTFDSWQTGRIATSQDALASGKSMGLDNLLASLSHLVPSSAAALVVVIIPNQMEYLMDFAAVKSPHKLGSIIIGALKKIGYSNVIFYQRSTRLMDDHSLEGFQQVKPDFLFTEAEQWRLKEMWYESVIYN